jgi:hypothetical protein
MFSASFLTSFLYHHHHHDHHDHHHHHRHHHYRHLGECWMIDLISCTKWEGRGTKKAFCTLPHDLSSRTGFTNDINQVVTLAQKFYLLENRTKHIRVGAFL